MEGTKKLLCSLSVSVFSHPIYQISCIPVQSHPPFPASLSAVSEFHLSAGAPQSFATSQVCPELREEK